MNTNVDIFLLDQLLHQPIKHFCFPLVDPDKVAVQLAAEKQSGMQHRTMLPDMPIDTFQAPEFSKR